MLSVCLFRDKRRINYHQCHGVVQSSFLNDFKHIEYTSFKCMIHKT
jgi:hypothetical protein